MGAGRNVEEFQSFAVQTVITPPVLPPCSFSANLSLNFTYVRLCWLDMKASCYQNLRIDVCCLWKCLGPSFTPPPPPDMWLGVWLSVKLDVYKFGTKLQPSALQSGLVVAEKCFLKKMKCSSQFCCRPSLAAGCAKAPLIFRVYTITSLIEVPAAALRSHSSPSVCTFGDPQLKLEFASLFSVSSSMCDNCYTVKLWTCLSWFLSFRKT